MTPPKVSILIPAYNQPELIERTLDSIEIQTFKDFEVVITDDSENDRVKDVVAEYSNLNMLYFKNPIRLGSPKNWNEAITRSSGEYIKFLHHDDWFANDGSLKLFVDALDNNPTAGFAFSRSITCNEGGTPIRYHSATENQIQKLYECNTSVFPINFVGAPSAAIYRRCLGMLFDTKLKWLVDIDFYIRVLNQNPNFVFIPKYLVNCSIGTQTVTQECTHGMNGMRIRFFEWMYVYSKINMRMY